MKNLDTANIATTLVLVVVAIVGGIGSLINPDALSFSEYVQNVGIAAGLLSVGRGLASYSRHK